MLSTTKLAIGLRFFQTALFVWLCVVLSTTNALANDGTAKTAASLKALIGLEIVGTTYPNGWTQIGSDGFGSSPYTLSTLRNSKTYGLLLERKMAEPKKGERIHVVVTDAIRVNDPTNQLKFSRLCYFAGDESRKTESNIFANVGFAKFCDLKTTLIRRAWKVNLQTGKFDSIQNTKGLICEYGFVSIGDTDFREGCPTYGLG